MRGRRAPSETNMAADMEQHVKGLTTSAATGQIDWDLLNSFFTTLWERRYKPVTGANMGHEYMHRAASYSGFAVNLAGAAAAVKGPAGFAGDTDNRRDERLDDDWV